MSILLDSDMLLFRACMAATVEAQLDDDVWVNWMDGAKARSLYWEYVAELCEKAKMPIDSAVHAFTSRSQFRRDLFPAYKANRKGPKPMGYKAMLQEVMASSQFAYQFDKIEADDVIGIYASMMKEAGIPFVIASGDKDMKQIPGHHVWLDSELTYVDEDEAELFFWRQVLMGDAADGIPGCPSVGEKTADTILQGFDVSKPVECWENVVRTYEKKGKVDFPQEAATLQARLVRILRTGDYDYENHQVSLWMPPTLKP
jgi:DNA polymerase-1